MTNHATRRLARPAIGLALAAAVAFGTAACGDDDKNDEGGAATGTEITIKDFSFSPDPLRAKVGDTITVKNDDGTPHTLTADDDSVDTGELDGGSSGSVELTKAGTLAYHCEIHQSTMKGSIEVTA
jgi:plastocyanin